MKRGRESGPFYSEFGGNCSLEEDVFVEVAEGEEVIHVKLMEWSKG